MPNEARDGCRDGSGAGYGSGTGMLSRRPDLRDLIDTSACARQVSPAPGWRVALDVETTKDEIVDVIAGTSDAMTACLVEAMWNVRLDPSTFVSPRERFHVALDAN